MSSGNDLQEMEVGTTIQTTLLMQNRLRRT